MLLQHLTLLVFKLSQQTNRAALFAYQLHEGWSWHAAYINCKRLAEWFIAVWGRLRWSILPNQKLFTAYPNFFLLILKLSWYENLDRWSLNFSTSKHTREAFLPTVQLKAALAVGESLNHTQPMQWKRKKSRADTIKCSSVRMCWIIRPWKMLSRGRCGCF